MIFRRYRRKLVLMQFTVGIAVFIFSIDTFEIQTAFRYVMSGVFSQPNRKFIDLADILIAVDDHMIVHIDKFLCANKGGEILLCSIYFRDMTERQRVGIIHRKTPVYVIIVNITGHIVNINSTHLFPAKFDHTLLSGVSCHSKFPFYHIDQFSVAVSIRLSWDMIKVIDDYIRCFFSKHLNMASNRICLCFHPFHTLLLIF